MKKSIYTLALSLTFCFAAQAQLDDQSTFSKNGRWLVETDFNIFSFIGTGGTGATIIIDEDGTSLTSFGAEIGKFTSENLALKFRFSSLSATGNSITTFGAGIKYYAGGKVPIDFGGGVITGGGESTFQGNISVGYAINLADNITLEPGLGILTTDGGTIGIINFGFSMFL